MAALIQITLTEAVDGTNSLVVVTTKLVIRARALEILIRSSEVPEMT